MGSVEGDDTSVRYGGGVMTGTGTMLVMVKGGILYWVLGSM